MLWFWRRSPGSVQVRGAAPCIASTPCTSSVGLLLTRPFSRKTKSSQLRVPHVAFWFHQTRPMLSLSLIHWERKTNCSPHSGSRRSYFLASSPSLQQTSSRSPLPSLFMSLLAPDHFLGLFHTVLEVLSIILILTVCQVISPFQKRDSLEQLCLMNIQWESRREFQLLLAPLKKKKEELVLILYSVFCWK